jgi:hypothetical protein
MAGWISRGWLGRQPQVLPDLASGLGIDVTARQRGELIANLDHRVTTFALAIVDPEAEAHRAGFFPDFGDEAVSLVHVPCPSADENIGHFCPQINKKLDKNVRHFRWRATQ